MKICPTCALRNPDSAQRCDCGYDFASATMQTSHAPPSVKPAKPGTFWGGFAAGFVAGLLGVIVCYVSREPETKRGSLAGFATRIVLISVWFVSSIALSGD